MILVMTNYPYWGRDVTCIPKASKSKADAITSLSYRSFFQTIHFFVSRLWATLKRFKGLVLTFLCQTIMGHFKTSLQRLGTNLPLPVRTFLTSRHHYSMGVFGRSGEVAKTQGLSTHLISSLHEDSFLHQQISNHIYNWFMIIHYGLPLATETRCSTLNSFTGE
jgi:hypothetical protein